MIMIIIITNQNNYISNNPDSLLYLRNITKIEICNIIFNMKNDSAPGMYSIKKSRRNFHYMRNNL